MPDRVFHIVAVNLSMQLELPFAFIILSGVVASDPSLPVVRLLLGHQFDGAIEIGEAFLNIAKFEMLLPALLISGVRLRFKRDDPVQVANRFIVPPQGTEKPSSIE